MSDLPATLADPQLERVLDDQGWVVVPLLDAGEVADLRSFYETRAEGEGVNPEGAYDPTYAEFSVVHSHPEFRAEAFERIVEVVGPRTAPLLTGHRPLVANYVNKPPGTGIVPVHQNWYVVDETVFRSISVWIALVDCTVDNGTLQFLPRSQRVMREPRGMWAYEAFADVTDALVPELEPVEVLAGQAIILDDAVVHYSEPNRSARDRLAIQLIMVPDAATALFCERVGEDDGFHLVDIWEVEPAFFFHFWHGVGDPRYGKVIERRRLPGTRIDEAELRDRFAISPS